MQTGIFATYPGNHLSLLGGFVDQVVGTALLIIVVLAVTDQRNVAMPHGTNAILLGLTSKYIMIHFNHISSLFIYIFLYRYL